MSPRTPGECVEPGCRAAASTRRRCDSCYRRYIRMGRYGYVDATEARAHVLHLRDLGWTWEQIAEAAGTSKWTASAAGSGRIRRLWPESARALLAIEPVPRGSHRGVDSTGTRRRVQALAWMGWPKAEVARRAGTTQLTLQTLILPTRRPSYTLARRVDAVYADLRRRTGPSKVAAGKARAAGFAPPLAWTAATIDDPRAAPCVEPRVLRSITRALDPDRLAAQGVTGDQAAERVAVMRAVLAWAEEHATAETRGVAA